mgnify:CR=1 FL=1
MARNYTVLSDIELRNIQNIQKAAIIQYTKLAEKGDPEHKFAKLIEERKRLVIEVDTEIERRITEDAKGNSKTKV